MIEPIGLGVVTIVGPAVSDFESVVQTLLGSDGLIQCDRSSLASTISNLLQDDEARHRIARNGQAVILRMQGATERSATAIIDALEGVDAG